MIEIRNVRKTYHTLGGVAVHALNGVSLKLADRGMVFLLGKSGSGKSTLLNVLGGLDSIDGGEIIFRGKSARDFNQSDYDSYRNTYVGFIFQEYNILEELTVGANVALAIELQGRKATDREVNDILAEVDLSGYGARKPGELSGGQKQRVAIARALVKHPEVIMADEPTGALDSDTGRQVFDTLKALSKERLVLVVSHDRDFAERYADRIIELADGSVISDVERRTDEDDKASSEGLRFDDGTVYVSKGYTITEEDRAAINEYLSRVEKSELAIKASDKGGAAREFSPTDESKIQGADKGDFRLIKSKLPIKTAFKLGSGGLKYKKFKLVLTIFLSLISFTLFGLADTIAAYDGVATATRSIIDSEVNYLTYSKSVKSYYGDGEYYWENWNTYLTDADISKIEEEMDLSLIGVFDKELALGYKQCIFGTDIENKSPERLYPSGFSGVAKLDGDIISRHGFKLVEGSRLPEAGKGEIIITKYVYDYFALMGYSAYDRQTGEPIKVEVTSPASLIGKTINLDLEIGGTNELKIVGIIDTGFDYSRYEPLMDDGEYKAMNIIVQMALMTELASAQEYSYHSVLFVAPSDMNAILSRAKNSAEMFNGYAEMYSVHDVTKGKYDDDNLVCELHYISALYKLDTVKDRVSWIGEPHQSLKDNEVILRSSALHGVLLNYASSGGKMPIPSALAAKLKVSVTHNGTEQTIKSAAEYADFQRMLDNLYDHAAYKYAADNFEEAKRYFELTALEEGASIDDVMIFDIISHYVSAIYESQDEGKPYGIGSSTLSEGVEATYCALLIDAYKSVSIPGHHVLSYDTYMGTDDSSGLIEDLKIVGVIPDGTGKLNMGTVVSDELYFKLTGGAANGTYSFAVGEMPDDYAGVKKQVEFSKEEIGEVRYDIRNSVMEELSFIDELLMILGKVFLYVGIGLALFASLMLSNFIGTSISYKKQEIGILRAIGSRSSDVFRIFFAESFIIAMINFALSVAGTLTVTLILNNLFRNELGILITFLNFGIRQVLLLLGVSLLVALVATFLPVRKIASMKPIDAIKNIK